MVQRREIPGPDRHKIELKVGTHSFTSSDVLPINSLGQPRVSYDATGQRYAVGVTRKLPYSTIYGFNGVFPGPMINAEYGKPVLVGSSTAWTRTRSASTGRTSARPAGPS